ncbi:hypothetical protein BKA69DRAFT_19616 [Paraphysoderma sedebokerense]|nr:hypothetical protein BKA69DRAFT_19616 [Paraphysoderma sedebokerense]
MPYNHPPSSNSTVSPSQMNLNQYLLSNNLPYDPAFANYQQQQAPESDASSVSSYRSSHSQHNAEDDNRSVESNENGAWRTAEADLSALNLGFEQATSSALGTDQTQQLNKPVVTLQFPSMDRKPVSVLINPVTENLNVPEGSTLRPADMNSFLTDISKFPLPLDLSPESFQFQQNDNGTVDVFASGHFFQTFEVAHPNTIERNTKLDLEGIYTDTSMSQNSNNQYYQTQNADPSGLLPPTAGRPRSPSPARRHRRRSRSPLSGSVHPADPALLLPPGASKARGRRRSTSPTAGSRDASPTGSASSNGSVNEDGKAKVTKSDKSAKKVYICNYPNCGQSFDRPYNLRNHELVHTGEKPHVCDLCNRGFR